MAVSSPSMTILSCVVCALLAGYVLALVAINSIPHISVRSFGWMRLKNVTISLKSMKISIGGVHLRLNIASWSSDAPFRMFNLMFSNVEIKSLESGDSPQSPSPSMCQELPSVISFPIPHKVYNVLFIRKWVNELAIHCQHLSFSHHELHKDVSFHIDYFRLEGLRSRDLGTHRFAISAIDGYVIDHSPGATSDQVRVLHNLEVGMSYAVLFICPMDKSDHIIAQITEIGFSFSVGELYVPKIPHLLDSANRKRKPKQHREIHLPSMRRVLALLNLLTSVQIKIEQSVIDYKELRFEWSSFAVDIVKDTSFKKQVVGKVSSYLTAGRMFHLDLKCVEVPSLTYLFETDITDMYRAYNAGDDQYFIDISVSLNVTNPLFNIYFDQLSYLLGSVARSKTSKKAVSTRAPKISKEKLLPLLNFFKKFRKASAKAVIVDTKATFLLPDIDKYEFHRDSLDNVITNAGIGMIAIKSSTKNLSNLIGRKCLGGNTPLTIKCHLKMKNIQIDVGENETRASNFNAIVGYCVDTNNIALKITSKSLRIRSVNTMLFHVIRRLQEDRIEHLNRACANIDFDCQSPSSVSEGLDKSTLEATFVDIFELLPPIVHSVRFQASLFQLIIICNDALPSHILSDKTMDKEIDLASFRRGTSLTLSEMLVDYKKIDELFKLSVSQAQVNTMSDLASEYTEDFDQMTTSKIGEFDFDDVSSLDTEGECFNDTGDDSLRKVKRALLINNLVIENPKGMRSKLKLHIPEVDGRIDIFLVWCVMYARTLVKMISPKVQKLYSMEQFRQLQPKERKINLEVQVDSIAVVARVVNNVDLLFEVDLLILENVLTKPLCQIKYCRLFVVHPTTKFWTRLISIAETFVDLSDLSSKTFTLNSTSVRFNIPFQFLVYTVIDNVITFVKAIKQVQQNFQHLYENNYDFSSIPQHVVPAVKMPRVRWKANTFGLTLENDPFEAELGMIFELGLVEQIERIRKEAHFAEKAEKIRKEAKDALTKKSVAARRFMKAHEEKKSGSKLKFTEIGPNIHETIKLLIMKTSVSKNSKTLETEHLKHNGSSRTKQGTDNEADGTFLVDTPFMTEDKANALISEAREALDKDFATSWILKYRRFKESHFKTSGKRARNLWGDDEINSLIKDKHEIQGYAPGVPQFAGFFKGFDLTVDNPRIPDLDEFLYKYGKGQPRLDYSILIPLFFHLRCNFVYFSIKDYPLPLLSFPENSSEDIPVMDFRGNIVINEKLVHMKEELRHIFVPFSPAIVDSNLDDSFYSAHIIRTLTPIKFMFDLTCDLRTDRACVFSWSKSYLPAISSIMSSFDNFTKPEIDDSPLGWWDKIALIAHGKIAFNIENELCFHMKSSNSPYRLIGDNSGFVFCWKNNVSLRINDTGEHSEIVILESDDFILGIPNYSTAENRSWSLRYDELHDYVHDTESESRKFLKRVMKLSSDEKVQWKLGFLFEQNVDRQTTELSSNQERTNKFKPHYDVRVTSPAYEWHPDSYEDYRSDYIHLAISVKSTSSKGNSHNAAYLTPLTIQYFFTWWNTISHIISLPVRDGPLFVREMKTHSLVKMGPHLFTFKYQLELEPLTISHVFLAHATLNRGQNVIATGLKGKFSRCVIDLHQRKEFVRYVNEKLGIDKKVRKLKLNLGEIDLTDADIRIMHASFSDLSLRAQLLSDYTSDSGELIGNESGESSEMSSSGINNTDWIRNISISGGDFLWLDPEDFVELEERQILSADPKVKIHPFFFTPKFTFFREFTLEVPEGAFPFGNERSHNCLIGAQSPEKVQEMILEKRSDNIRKELEENITAVRQLEKINDPVFKNDYERIKTEIVQNEERLEKVNMIYEGVRNTSRPASLNEVFLTPNGASPNGAIGAHSECSSQSSINRVVSRQPTIYSTIMEDAREVTSVNTSVSAYHNRFLLHNLQLKWNNKIRDMFVEYLLLAGESKSSRFAMTRKAMDLVESLLKNALLESDVQSDRSSTGRLLDDDVPKVYASEGDLNKAFDEYLDNIEGDDEEIEYKFLIKLIRPQVQMISDANLPSCILETSQQIEMRIVCVNVAGTNDIISEGSEEMSLIETRYGVLFQDSHFFAFNKDKFPDQSTDPYGLAGTKKTWPPWVDLEVCDDSSWLEDDLIVERTSMSLTHKKPNTLFAENRSRANELHVNLAKLVFNATSSQYSALYFIVTDLLVHSKPARDAFHQRLDQILAVTDISDYLGISEKVQQLQVNIRICRNILLRMDQQRLLLSDQELRERAHVETELEKMKLDLDLIITGLKTLGSKMSRSHKVTQNWHIRADQVIWHFLEDNREPLIDLALATSNFTRIDHYDGSNSNTVEISMAQGFNLSPKAVYPELLRPYLEIVNSKKDSSLCKKNEPIIKMDWKMLNPVGGIRVMSNSELLIQPLNIQLDYETATKMFSYIFPKDEKLPAKDKSSPLADESDALDNVSMDSQRSSETSSNPFRKFIAKRRRPHSPASTTSRTSSATSGVKRDEVFDVSSTESSTASYNTSVTDLKDLKHLADSKKPAEQKAPCNPIKRRRAKKLENNIDDVALIMNRSSKYIVIGDVLVNKVKLLISFLAPKHLNIIDVHKLQLSLPRLHYKNKTWTGEDFANQVKKDIIKMVLSHSAKVIGNKFKHRHRKVAATPLNQISDYSLYMTLDDLQVDGRAREEKHVSLRLGANDAPRILIPSIKKPGEKRKAVHRNMVDLSEVFEELSEDSLNEEKETSPERDHGLKKEDGQD